MDRVSTYKQAIQEVVEFLNEGSNEHTIFEMQDNEGYRYFVDIEYGIIRVFKNTFGQEGEYDIELTIRFNNDVEKEFLYLKCQDCVTTTFKEEYTMKDHLIQTVSYTHYCYS